MTKIIKETKSEDDRPLGELISILGNDFEGQANRLLLSIKKRKELSKRDKTNARNLIRCLFSLVEGVISAIKMHAIVYRRALKQIKEENKNEDEEEVIENDDYEYFGMVGLVFEERFDIDNDGKMITRPTRILLERNIKFTFRILSDIYNIPNKLDLKTKWWSALMRSKKVRDRITHPKDPTDLDISYTEILDAITAENGFRNAVTTMVVRKGRKK